MNKRSWYDSIMADAIGIGVSSLMIVGAIYLFWFFWKYASDRQFKTCMEQIGNGTFCYEQSYQSGAQVNAYATCDVGKIITK